jgi:predicted acetyltransferase
MLNVRLATAEDMPFLLEQGEQFIDYIPQRLKFDPMYITDILTGIMEKGIILVAVEDDQPIGGIGGMPVKCVFDSNHITMTELFLWVNPEHRKGSAMIRLIKMFEADAKSLGADAVALCHTNSTPSLGKIYERYGYSLAESTYYKEV